MINSYFLDVGTFPDIAFFNGDVWAVVQPNATTLKLYREDKLAADIPCQSDLAFPKLHAFQNHLWLAYRDDVEGGKLHNLSLNVESVFAPHVDGNSPILLEHGRVVWQESGRVKWLALDRLNEDPKDARLETRPTGLSRLNESGFPIFIDDDRFLVPGTTIPTFAGPLSASERHDSGALILDAGAKKALTLWPGLDSFTPRIIALPDGEYAVTTWGSRTARVAAFHAADLQPIAAPVPLPVPAPQPQPTPLAPPPMSLIAPNKIETIRRAMREHPEINTCDEDQRGRILDYAAADDNATDPRRPWGRKSRNREGTNLNTDGYTFLRPDGLFEIYDVISGVDGAATWEGFGPFRQGENGYWVSAKPVAAPQPAPQPSPTPAPQPTPPPVERLDLAPLLAKLDEISIRNEAALQAATITLVQALHKAVFDVKSGVKVKF